MLRSRLLASLAVLSLATAVGISSADTSAARTIHADTHPTIDPLSCPFCGGSMDDFEAFVRRSVRAHLVTLLASSSPS